jgi:periplasmic protein TonB
MFSELLESTIVKRNTNKRWTVALSSIVQTLLLGVLVMIPLMHTEALPKAMIAVGLFAPPPPPPAPARTARATVRPSIRQIRAGVIHPPTFIPTHVEIVNDLGLALEVDDSGPINNAFRDIPGQDPIAGNRPAVPPPPKQAVPTRIKQGGVVTAASLLSQTKPIYPILARQAGIQGNVVLHATIDKDGRVAQLEVVSGHPLLVQAALDAVRQWLYKPTLLNGEPVEVDTTITVTFVMAK